jgi:hypothetical protein
VETAHRVEVDRLLAVVDLIVWVLHPQKYADKVVHRQYIERFHRHSEVTVVALNQVDLLSEEDLGECLTDLRALLAAGEGLPEPPGVRSAGLAGVPVVTTSAKGPPGVAALAQALRTAVAAREAALIRLGADLDGVAADLEPLTAPSTGDPAELLDQGPLVAALGKAAGVPLVAEAVERAYVHRARRVNGWPPLRWFRRFRPDPLLRLHLGGNTPEATSIAPAAPAARAATGLAVRALSETAGTGLPEPWRDAVLTAARSTMDELPDALDLAVASADLGVPRKPLWWRAIGLLQWVTTIAVAAGLLWLAVRYIMFALALPEPPLPHVGRLPLPTALLLGGLLAAFLIALVARPVTRFAARRARRRAESRLRAGIERVAQDKILDRVRAVLSDYEAARTALDRAGAATGRR